MKLGLISYDFYPAEGGQGVIAYQLYRRLSGRHGLDVGVVSSSVNQLKGHVSLPVGHGPGPAPLRFSARLNHHLPRLVRSQGFDVLQMYGGPGGVMLLRGIDIPVIYVANHTYAQQERYLGRKIYRILAAAEKAGYARAKHIVSISSTTAQSLIDDYSVPASKVTIIPIGVDTGFFRPLPVEVEGNSMLFVGRLCERKGIHYLLEACVHIRNRVPDFRLYIVGEGGLRESLVRMADGLGLGGCVHFLGKLGDEELVGWYNKASLFCLPALFEGFGIVCLEAMACGTPVLASRAPGIIDVIPEEHGELMFETGNSRELAEKAIDLLSDAEKRRAVGESLRRAAGERFEWDAVASRFVELYNDEIHA